jgi:hypothetical protein
MYTNDISVKDSTKETIKPFLDNPPSEHIKQVLENTIVYFTSPFNYYKLDIDEFVKFYESLNKKIQKVILVSTTEAPHSSFWIQFVHTVKKTCNITDKDILILDGGMEDKKEAVYQKEYLPTFLRPHPLVIPQHLFTQKTRLFLALSRIPKLFRILFTQELLRRNLVNEMSVVSCGSESAIRNPYIEVDENLRQYFPLLVDGITGKENNHNFFDNEVLFSSCLFNVVIETSYSNDVYISKIGAVYSITNSWTRPFLTEKTNKAFFWKQIPIFLAPPGYVSIIRNLGFDVFDDVVNHDYDTILDGYARMNAVVNEIERLSKIGLNTTLNTTTNLYNRLLYNHNQVKVAKNNTIRKLYKSLEDFFNQ